VQVNQQRDHPDQLLAPIETLLQRIERAILARRFYRARRRE
jgi:hypothetical protein